MDRKDLEERLTYYPITRAAWKESLEKNEEY